LEEEGEQHVSITEFGSRLVVGYKGALSGLELQSGGKLTINMETALNPMRAT
jgi:hypothetical protein